MIKISWSCPCDFVTLKLFSVSSQRLCASESSPLLTYYSGLVICVSHYMGWNAPSSFQPQVIPGSWFRQSLKPSLLSQDHNFHGNTNSYLNLHPTPLPAIIRVILFSALMLKMTLDNFSTLLFCILSHCLVRCHMIWVRWQLCHFEKKILHVSIMLFLKLKAILSLNPECSL